MAFMQERRASVGELLSGTFTEIAGIKREIALYFGAVLFAGLAADLIEALRGGIGAAAFFGYFAGQYYLYRAMLRRSGVIYDPRFKVFSLLFMALLLVLPISFGLQIFLIPGILLAAKWIMAPTFLVAEEMNLIEAIGASWRASSGNTLALSGVLTLIGLIWFFVFGIGGNLLGRLADAAVLGGLGRDVPNAFGWLLIQSLPVLLMGFSVSAYRTLSDSSNDYVSVFE